MSFEKNQMKTEIENHKNLNNFYKYYDKSDYTKAMFYLNKMELNQKDSSWIYAKLGECHYELRNYGEAIKYCEFSLEVQKRYPLALWTLGNAFYYVKKYKEAIKVFKTITKMTEFEIGKVETRLGVVWGRSLKMDCYIKLSDNYYMSDKDIDAKKAMQDFISLSSTLSP
jgi:tetratricopeptide (TPR) repeat protein